ncbi:MAG: chemotaxis-specific protein-glutamate methyltransferase CheB [Phycisphaerales bacterium]
MRVLVCDDSAVMRKAISRVIEAEPGMELVGTARNGLEGVEKVKSLRPDAVTLDIEMPELDGLGALTRIMSECPTPVLMCSSLTTEGSHAALTALRLGAVDFLAKDPIEVAKGTSGFAEKLVMKLKTLGASRVGAKKPSVQGPPASRMAPTFRPLQFDAILIGSSTGGPPVLEEIIESLPEDLSAPVVIAQHMPLLFTQAMTERLARVSKVRVVLGSAGARMEAGVVYVCPGGSHGRVVRGERGALTLEVGKEPSTALYKPSVDELFLSGARTVGARCLGVVLTGMGEDGLIGGRELKARGAVLLAQDAETSVVYGMPRAVTAAGLTQASLTPKQIGAALGTLRRSRAASAA